jgi:HPt (histidine-containing phosphotransfer) domain-containing protein
MTNIEDKLSAIHTSYENKLQLKIHEIQSLWDNLMMNWNTEELTKCHSLVHTLHGSAGTFGFNEVSTQARKLEIILKEILDQDAASLKQIEMIQQLLVDLSRH